jgi:hypothetical protein
MESGPVTVADSGKNGPWGVGPGGVGPVGVLFFPHPIVRTTRPATIECLVTVARHDYYQGRQTGVLMVSFVFSLPTTGRAALDREHEFRGIEVDALLEHHLDVAHVGDARRRIAIDDEVGMLAGRDRPDVRIAANSSRRSACRS